MAVMYMVIRLLSSHFFEKYCVETRLIQNDVGLMRQTSRSIRSPARPYQLPVGLLGPEC